MNAQQDFLRQCLHTYLQIGRECRRYGLDHSAIRRSQGELSELRCERWYLRPEAFDPSGVALGRPLPDAKVTRLLWRASQLANKKLETLTGSNSCVAFVAPEYYHITVLNRDHFDIRQGDHSANDLTDERSREITMLSEAEFEDCAATVRRLSLHSTSVLMRGVVLTASGRLLVTAYPFGEEILFLRRELLAAMPTLRSNVPVPSALTIKVGHLRHLLTLPQLYEFLGWLGICGEHLCARLRFTSTATA